MAVVNIPRREESDMSTWLDSIQDELDLVDEGKLRELDFPEECRPAEDNLVGVLDIDLLKLLFLTIKRREQALDAFVIAWELGDKECQEKLWEATKLEKEAEALQEIFWVECCAAFPVLWNKPIIGLRRGWKLVWNNDPRVSGASRTVLAAVFVEHSKEAANDSPSVH